MKFVLSLLIVLLASLIKIGNLVQFILKLIVLTLRKLSEIAIYTLYRVTKFLKNLDQETELLVGNTFVVLKRGLLKLAKILFFVPDFLIDRLRSLSTLLHLPSPRRKKRYGDKKKAKVIFKSRTPFFVKLRYASLGFALSFVFIFFPFSVFVFAQNLPNPKELTSRDIAQTTKIYDRNGNLLFQIYANENRTLVPLEKIPRNLIYATISIEDKDFYSNPGFDVKAITRAAISNLSGEPLQGGSTITQQLIKSSLLTPEVTISRKVKEIILAFWAERIYTKDQVLEMYFNQVPYGGTSWGVQAASEVYFGKDVSDLTLAESAFLAGMTRAPSIYTPYGSTPNLWKSRQEEVLKRMHQLGYITKEQREDALKEELAFQAVLSPISSPHFVMYVRDLLVRKYGLAMVEKGGLKVITTLDGNIQEMAENVVSEEITNHSIYNISNGAALITNPKNGDVLGMVGSRDYDDPNGGKVNLTTALRQPGSSIKPVTYSAALTKGFTAATIIDDSPVTYRSQGAPSYSPVNYDGQFHGRVPLRLALANSFNIPAVKTLDKIGVSAMVNLGKQMGISSWKEPDQYGLSITLGAAEVRMIDMAEVYGTLSNLGEQVDVDPILKITDYKGNIIQEKKEVGKQVLPQGVAFIVSDILSDNKSRAMEFGVNSALNIPGKTVSVKTGTTDNKRDNWTIGYTPEVLVATWVGNNDNSPMSQTLASGITGAAPIWNRIMSDLLKNKPDLKQKIPSDIVQKNCLGRVEYFVKGTENTINCAAFTPTPSVIQTEVNGNPGIIYSPVFRNIDQTDRRAR